MSVCCGQCEGGRTTTCNLPKGPSWKYICTWVKIFWTYNLPSGAVHNMGGFLLILGTIYHFCVHRYATQLQVKRKSSYRWLLFVCGCFIKILCTLTATAICMYICILTICTYVSMYVFLTVMHMFKYVQNYAGNNNIATVNCLGSRPAAILVWPLLI